MSCPADVVARLARAARHFRALYGPGGPEHGRYRRQGRAPEFVFRYATQQAARYHLRRLPFEVW